MFRTMLLVALATLLLADPAAARERRNLNVLQESARTVEGGRAVNVSVAQPELGAAINPSNVTGAMGGGLIGAMIDSSIQANRSGQAEVGITPIRATLFDFDVDALAIETTDSVIEGLPWFGGQAATFSRDPSPFAKNAALDATSTGQVAFFDYGYEMSPDFSSVRVSVGVTIANKVDAAVRRPEQRLQPRYLAYSQVVTSVVQLPNATTAEENSVRWAADDGALVRQGLRAAFADISTLLPRALQFSDADVTAAAAAPRDTSRTYPGARVIEQNETGTLFYTGGLIHVQTLGQ
ncbi:MAG: hypothetical protein NT015_05380 [Alphaproteobacteria bacterium]|nr:hypothetical protein [Alphaproteobacteria bacterium]